MSRYKEGDIVKMYVNKDCPVMVVVGTNWDPDSREMYYKVYRDGMTMHIAESWLTKIT
jgi:hypothetical protein